MKLNSPKLIIDKSQQEVIDFLNDINNFEKLMPENTSKFETIGEDSFVFALTGMPEVALQKKASSSPNRLELGAAGGKLDFNLTAEINELSNNTSEVQFLFKGDFNAMIGMMVKGPISKLIETLLYNIPRAI